MEQSNFEYVLILEINPLVFNFPSKRAPCNDSETIFCGRCKDVPHTFPKVAPTHAWPHIRSSCMWHPILENNTRKTKCLSPMYPEIHKNLFPFFTPRDVGDINISGYSSDPSPSYGPSPSAYWTDYRIYTAVYCLKFSVSSWEIHTHPIEKWGPWATKVWQ